MISDNYNFRAINSFHLSYLVYILKVSSILKTFNKIRISILKVIFLSGFSNKFLKNLKSLMESQLFSFFDQAVLHKKFKYLRFLIFMYKVKGLAKCSGLPRTN